MEFVESKTVLKQLRQHPAVISKQLLAIRELIKQVVAELESEGVVEETLKWSEPSYTSKYGSTIRINRYRQSEAVAIFFNCQSSLVETFRELYSDSFEFEGNRAIILAVNHALPANDLLHCIQLALTYHKVKHLPLLGA